jgi:hypothetical protein
VQGFRLYIGEALVEIEGFSEIMDIIGIAKFLHGIGRFDIVENRFNDVLCYDLWIENMWGVITSIFSGFTASSGDETETMIFTDEVLSGYFIHAQEYGKKTGTPPERNQYVLEALDETRQCLYFSYNLDWKLLGYTKSKRAAMKSKLVIYTCSQEFCEYDYLAYGLAHLYKWFKDKRASFGDTKEVNTE